MSSFTHRGHWLKDPQWLPGAYLLGFLACAGLLGAAYYFEYVMFLDPCPLCMAQRVATAIIGVGFLLAFIGTKLHWLMTSFALTLTLAGAVLGAWLADHQIWLQHLPKEEVPACGPSVDYLIETLPLTDLISIMLEGDGNCAEIVWTFLGMSMPQWTLVCFIGFALSAFFALFHTLRQHKNRNRIYS